MCFNIVYRLDYSICLRKMSIYCELTVILTDSWHMSLQYTCFSCSILRQSVGVGRGVSALRDETDDLDPFQYDFRPGYGMETALVALGDDLHWKLDKGSMSLWVLQDLSASFNTIDTLLVCLSWMGFGGTVLLRRWFGGLLFNTLANGLRGLSGPFLVSYVV